MRMQGTWQVEALDEFWPTEDRSHWLIYRVQGKLRDAFFLPKATLAIRALEYGYDPADTVKLLDLVLHESAMPQPNDDRTWHLDPAIKLGLTVPQPFSEGNRRAGTMVGVTCYTAETLDDARAAHLARLKWVKDNNVLNIVDGASLLGPIHEHIETEFDLDAYRKVFHGHRESHRRAIAAYRSRVGGAPA